MTILIWTERASGKPEKFKDAELEVLKDKDQWKTLNDHLEMFKINRSGLKERKLSAIRIEVKRHTCKYELLLQRQRRDFLHRIATWNTKWMYYVIPERGKSWCSPSQPSTYNNNNIEYPSFEGDALYSCTMKMGVVYLELHKIRSNDNWGSLLTTVFAAKPGIETKTTVIRQKIQKVEFQSL